MVGPKNSRSIDRLPEDVANPVAKALSAFLKARLPSNLSSSSNLRLCVALSGGRDSVVLLHALCRLVSASGMPVVLSAVHVHHGLSFNADAWVGFCTQLCAASKVPLRVIHVEVQRDSGEGLEGAARRVRHAAFADCDTDWLALAHHRDDQAETVLLELLRGAGVVGAAGMLAQRSQARGPTLVRPLLAVPRAEIESYAVEHGLRWIDDESNDDVRFRRNFLRHDVLPRLDEKFPGAQKSLARAAGHFAEASALLDELAELDRVTLATPSGRIAVSRFNALTPARARNLLRFAWVEAGFRAPDTRWIDEALQQLAGADASSEICLATADGELHVYRDELHLVDHAPVVSAQPVLWSGEAELPWAGGYVRFVPAVGEGVRRSLLEGGGVALQARHGGERLQLHPRRPRRSLRKLLQEAAVPPWERERLPFLWCNDHLLWVGGLGADVAFVCTPGETGVLPVWVSSGSDHQETRMSMESKQCQ